MVKKCGKENCTSNYFIGEYNQSFLIPEDNDLSMKHFERKIVKVGKKY